MSHCKTHQGGKRAWPKLQQVPRHALMGMLAIAGLAAAPAQAQISVSTIQRTSAFEYDATNGLLTKEIIEPGDSTLCVVNLYEYDAFGNRKKATTRNCNGASGNAAPTNSEAAAPATGNLALFTSRSASTDYGTSGQFPLSTTNALGQSETKTYDARFGVITSLIGPNALTTRWAYDDFGRKVLEERADGTGTRWTYEYCTSVSVNGTAGTATCPTIAGAVGAYVITSVTVKSPSAANNTDGGAIGPYGKTYYDSLGRSIRSETQGFDGAVGGGTTTAPTIYQDTEYNVRGLVSRKSRPYAAGAATVYWTSFSYDTLGRIVQETAPDASVSKVVYAGLTITSTNALNQTRSETRNEAGQIATVTDAAGKTLTRSYDPLGNLIKATDAAGNVTQLTYDTRGRKTKMVDPDMGTWTYVYNALGELVQQTDAKAQVTTMSYDVLGRLTAKQEPSLNANWYYDTYKDGTACTKGIGKLCEASSNNGYGRKHSYDSLGRAISTATTVGTTVYTSATSYVADATSPDYQRIKDITYPSGLKLAYVYTPLGSLQKVVAASNVNQVYWRQDSADAEGHILQQTYGNNVITRNSYDPKTGRLVTRQAGVSTSTINYVQDASYSYDSLGNLKSQSDVAIGRTAAYDYDSLNRLKTETRTYTGLTSPTAIGWTYDDIGNITSRSDVGTYSYPTSGATSRFPHAVSSITGTVNGLVNPTYTYDANGNVTYTKDAGGIRGFVTWTSFNKVNALLNKPAVPTGAPTPPSTTLTFLYDAEGERVQETVKTNGTTPRITVYLNPGAGAGLYYEEDTLPTTTKKKHYISAGGGTIGVLTLDTATNTWSTQYWHKDQLGSTMAVTDAGAWVTENLAYEPFGKRRKGDGTTDLWATSQGQNTNRGFTGHEMMDEVGLINMNGRIYNPAIGRFLSADPYIQAPDELQSYNRYSYGWNNPLSGTDPTGYCFAGCFWHGHRLAQPVRGMWTSQAKIIRELPLPAPVKQIVVTAGCLVATAGSYAPGCAALGSAVVAKSYGASDWATLKGAGISAATAYAFQQVGTATDMHGTAMIAKASPGQIALNVLGHAAVGCASAAASGGDCGAGAAAAAVGDLGTIGGIQYGVNPFATTVVSGGLGSVAAGGKFADGAATAAMGYLFNAAAGAKWSNDNQPKRPCDAGCQSFMTGAGMLAVAPLALIGAPEPELILLSRALASEAQVASLMAGEGVEIAGAGTSTVLRDAPRLAAEYGGKVGDWSKVTSQVYKAADGFIVETHGYVNKAINAIVEFKSKVGF